MRPCRSFSHVAAITVARGHSNSIVPFHYSSAPSLGTETFEFRIIVYADGSFAARLNDPAEHFSAPLFNAFVEAHPDAALRAQLRRHAF